jgi:ubiquinone/menaquinone biosynthesis C-methylase UbiE
VRDMEAKVVQEFFERVAVDWDTMRLAYYDERVIERMAAVSGVNEGMIVADVGTGMGFVAAGIAPRGDVAGDGPRREARRRGGDSG